MLEQIVDAIPMGRLAQPEEIAGLVAYLASEEAGYITGANISINGGLHMDVSWPRARRSSIRRPFERAHNDPTTRGPAVMARESIT